MSFNISSITKAITTALTNQPLFASGKTVVSPLEFTRPADTTAYSTYDTVSDSTTAPTILTFPNMGRANGGSGYIVKGVLKTNANIAAAFRLHLFTTATPDANRNDNSSYIDRWSDRDNYVGYVDFDLTNIEAGGTDVAAKSQNTSLRLAYVCGAGTTSLYGILEARNGFTPTSGQKFNIKLTAEQY